MQGKRTDCRNYEEDIAKPSSYRRPDRDRMILSNIIIVIYFSNSVALLQATYKLYSVTQHQIILYFDRPSNIPFSNNSQERYGFLFF